jgi:4-hydroxyphenylpyruvate dioxygenase-like putative hemolysin
VRELSELGLLDALAAVAIPTGELVYYSRHGQRIWGEPRGLAEKRAPNGFQNLDEVISREEMDEIARFYKRTAGFDPESLNKRPSLSVR